MASLIHCFLKSSEIGATGLAGGLEKELGHLLSKY
jgi:hypothetical protein